MSIIIDQENWKRRAHFEFFNSFEEPYFGIVTEIDCTMAFHQSKENDSSFFLQYLYHTLCALNSIEEFRLRVVEDKVVLFDEIHASATIDKGDQTFAFSFIPFYYDFERFMVEAKKEIELVKQSEGLNLNENTGRVDVVHISSAPWFKFTGLTHARMFSRKDSVPKISFGRYFNDGLKLKMNISIHGHHGLMDGYHVGKFLDEFQRLMNQ